MSVDVHSLTNAVLARSFDVGAIQRGRAYAAQGRVQLLRHGGNEAAGLVEGNSTDPYFVDVEWFANRGSVFVNSYCTCPVGDRCKHAIALIVWLQATGAAAGPHRPNWRASLDSLRTSVEQPTPVVPLALEVSVEIRRPTHYQPNPPPDVTLRPLRLGAKGKWIRSAATWRDIASPYGYQLADAEPCHRNALRALLWSTGSSSYNIGAVVSLGDAGHGVWDALRRATDAGVTLVGASRSATAVQLAASPARAVVDLTSGPDDSVYVTAHLAHDDPGLDAHLRAVVGPDGGTPAGLLGQPPHGAVVSTAEAIWLVPFDRPLHPDVAALVRGVPVEVPSDDLDELFDDYLPAVATQALVASSDGSVTVALSEFETLVASIRRPRIDAAELSWSVRYRRGSRVNTYPLTAPLRAGRSPEAETAALAELELPTHLLPRLAGPNGISARLHVTGRDAITLLNDVLPWLIARDQVDIEVDSQLPALREATADPLISLNVTDPEGDATGVDAPTDWFDLSVDITVDGERIGFADLFAALTLDEELLVLPSGTWLRLDRPEFERLRELIGEASGLDDRPGAAGGSRDGSVRINRFQTSWWDDLAALGVVGHQSERWQRSVAQLASLSAPVPVPTPVGLEATLRDYQQEGLDWLAFLVDNGLGGVLADDMGLGKTVQTLALMLHVLERSPDARFLVVAPTSVVENWHREAGKFAPSITVRTVSETAKRRGIPLSEAIDGAQLVVTSYALFRLEFDDYQAHSWDVLVLDEAQFVKNHHGKTYQCVRRLTATSKIAITGTPLENSLMDLWSLLSIAAPGLYPDPKKFSDVYRSRIESGAAPELLATLRRRIAPLMRRRTKDDVLAELPPKTELTIEVAMNARHARIYQTQLQRQRQKVLGLVDDMQKNRFEILKSLTLLRQLSLDPGLVDPAHEGVGSAKLDRLLDDLEQVVAEGHRALVFSQFTRYLAKVKARLDEAGIDYAYLDGRTRKRDAAISRFKDGNAPVFVISLKAGGFGLSLTEADYCFVLDPWWNPAVETQAVDRTHRIGQRNAVMVYRYVSADTIEEKVMELKARKSALFSSVMADDGALSGALGADDIRGLFE